MQESFTVRTSNEEETKKLGEIIGTSLEPGSIIALRGELGAGKTVLVKGIAKGLNIREEPTSPTYIILNIYEGKMPLYHFDLYRLSGSAELEGIGYEEYFFGEGVSVVEWADRAEEIFPEDTINIEIEIPENTGNENKVTVRRITARGNREWLLSFKSTAEQALQI